MDDDDRQVEPRPDVTLRPVAHDDLEIIERFLTDPGAAGPFLWKGWTDLRRVRRDWERDGLTGRDGGRLMVVQGDERLGFTSYRKVVTGRDSHCWSIGIALLPEARGRGAGTLAQRWLARYLFAHTQAARVQAETDIDNIAEQRALEKAGFTREGVMRQWAYHDGRWRDEVIYSVLRHEAT